MPINLVAMMHFDQHKIGYTEVVKDAKMYQKRRQYLLDQSDDLDLSFYGLRRVDTKQPGLVGLRQIDSFYDDMIFYDTFAEFQAHAREFNQITDVDLKRYWIAKFNVKKDRLDQLLNQMQSKLNFSIVMTNDPIETVSELDAAFVLVNKLALIDDSYQQWQIINDVQI